MFKANKLSLYEEKAKNIIFHKKRKKDNLLLKLSNLFINERKFERVASLKFLGVMFDENISWDPHIQLSENKVSRNTGVLCKIKHILSKDGLLFKLWKYRIQKYKQKKI